MRFISRGVTMHLVALASALSVAVSCAEPTAPSLARMDEVELVSSKDDNNAKKADVHAIHVQITNMVFGATTVDRYSFHAMEHDGDVKGNFFLYQLRIIEGVEDAVVIASGPMECVTVNGNKAKVGGRVTYTTFPEGIPMGSEVTWSVTDNGKSAKADDSASQPLGNNARAFCDLGLPYPESPVERGKIQIKS
jgi:hypothetical protein